MSQSLTNIYLHIVFSTKYREPLIVPGVQEELYRYIGAVCRSCGSPSLAIGGIEDHIHLACTLGRSITIYDLVQEIKTSSSKWMKGKEIPSFSWQSGYGAFSFGPMQVGVITRYIAHQRQHHGRLTFCQEFRGLLVHHDLPFDERTVWD
jgi:putative transposase